MLSLMRRFGKGRLISSTIVLVMAVALLAPVTGGADAFLHDAVNPAVHTSINADCPHQAHHDARCAAEVAGKHADCTGLCCAQCQCFTILIGQASVTHVFIPLFVSTSLSGLVEQRFSRLERPPKYPVV